MRAALDNLRAGQIEQGGSTIEQQVVRNLYLSDEQSFTRKIREAYLAMQMSDRWTKDQILTEYLNIVPYGAITYGCEAAAQRYFDKSCKSLNLWQAATLAGIPQNPLVYNPVDNRQAAKQRRNDVLDAMLAQGVITQRSTTQAETHKIMLHASPFLDPTPSRYGYFISYVRDVLAKRWPAQTVRKGGLAVHTSLDRKLQNAAHQALTDNINWADAPAAAMVAIDPRTGEVLAMDSSVPYSKSQQFNFPVAARRQAGSTFKAFTLATAISQGINPDTSSELSAHLSYTVPGTLEPWEVDTRGGQRVQLPAHDHRGHDRVRQHRVRPPVDRRRREQHRRHGAQAGDPALDQPEHRAGGHARRQPGVAAVDDVGLRDAGQQRHPPCARPDRDGVQHRDRQDAGEGLAQGQARDPRRRRLRGRLGARPDRQRHGQQDAALPRRAGRQDRHDQRPQGRLVLRVHADAGGLRLAGLPEGRDPDDHAFPCTARRSAATTRRSSGRSS